MDKENIELAEEHVKIAEDLVAKEGINEDSEEKKKLLLDAELSLEKAEADLSDSE